MLCLSHKCEPGFNIALEKEGGEGKKQIITVRVACVASVPVPGERNSGRAKGFFRIRAARKMRREQCSRPIFRAAGMRKPLSRGPNFVRVVRERLLRRLPVLK